MSSDFAKRHLFVAVQTLAHIKRHTLKITDAIGFCITTVGSCISKNNDSKNFYGYVNGKLHLPRCKFEAL